MKSRVSRHGPEKPATLQYKVLYQRGRGPCASTAKAVPAGAETAGARTGSSHPSHESERVLGPHHLPCPHGIFGAETKEPTYLGFSLHILSCHPKTPQQRQLQTHVCSLPAPRSWL